MTEKTAAEKLLIKPGRRVRFDSAPADVVALLGGLPEGAVLAGSGLIDVLVLFANHRAELEARLPGLRAELAPGGMLWVAYPKGTSKIKTDIHRDTIAAYAQTLGLIAVAMVAINDDWAALRLKPA